jgi:hypothetical protein
MRGYKKKETKVEYLYTDSDGITTKFTDDMIKSALDERVQLRKDLNTHIGLLQNRNSKFIDLRINVYDFFNERYDSGDNEITCTVDDVNELLEYIGADKLKRLWTVSGRIEFTITDIEADSEDEARDMVENNLSVEFDGNIVDDYNIDVHDVEQQ